MNIKVSRTGISRRVTGVALSNLPQEWIIPKGRQYPCIVPGANAEPGVVADDDRVIQPCFIKLAKDGSYVFYGVNNARIREIVDKYQAGDDEDGDNGIVECGLCHCTGERWTMMLNLKHDYLCAECDAETGSADVVG